MCLRNWENVLFTYDSTTYFSVIDKLNGAGIKHKSRIRRAISSYPNGRYEILVPAEVSGLAYKAIHSDLPLKL